jgi:hypothetical protein
MILVCDAPGLQFLALIVPKLHGVYRWLLLDVGKQIDGVCGVLQTANRFCVIGAVYRGHPPLLGFSTLLCFDPFSPQPSTITLLTHPSMPPFPMSKTYPSRWGSNPQGPNQQLPMTLAGTSNTPPLGPPTTPRLPRNTPIKRTEKLLPKPFAAGDWKVVSSSPKPLPNPDPGISPPYGQVSTPAGLANFSPNPFILAALKSSTRALLDDTNRGLFYRRSPTFVMFPRHLMEEDTTIPPGWFCQFYSDCLH